jgi:hypothetical protein
MPIAPSSAGPLLAFPDVSLVGPASSQSVITAHKEIQAKEPIMTTLEQFLNLPDHGRKLIQAVQGDQALGKLSNLPGSWQGQGRGWNMIALPDGSAPRKFRLLLNQFNEELDFTCAFLNIPNRGIPSDQFLTGLQYTQDIKQIVAVDSEGSSISPLGSAAIHHEPGFFLNIINPATQPHGSTDLDIARLGTIPHGDSLVALGTGIVITPPTNVPDTSPSAIGDFSALPIGAGPRDLNNPYLQAYKQFHLAPFKGNVGGTFPGFDPTQPLDLLGSGGGQPFLSVQRILVDTHQHGGISNMPFVVRQANATEMRFAMWIEELQGSTAAAPQFQLQYAQRVLLEFFDRTDGVPGKIKWPHITINTLTLTQQAVCPQA